MEAICGFIFFSVALLSVTGQGPPHCQSVMKGDQYSCATLIVNTVSIDVNGTDVPKCVTTNGTIPCQSLHYALNQMNKQPQKSSASSTWLMLISSDQVLTSPLQVTFNVTFSCLILCGTGTANKTAILSNENGSFILPVINIRHKSIYNTALLVMANLRFDFGLNVHSIANESVIVSNFRHFVVSNAKVTHSYDWLISVRAFIITKSTLYDNYYTKALLNVRAYIAYMTNVQIEQTFAKPFLPYETYGPVFIIAYYGQAWVENCSFNNSKILGIERLQVFSSSLVIIAFNKANVMIYNSSFSFADDLFLSSVYISAQGGDSVLSGLTIHDNHYDILTSLGHITVSSRRLTVRHLSFFKNSGNAIVFPCERCDELNVTDCSFHHSEGTVMVAKAEFISLTNISVSMMSNELYSDVALFNLDSVVSFDGYVIIKDNIGTAIRLTFSTIRLLEGVFIEIVNNTGRHGGAMALDKHTYFDTSSFPLADVNLINNTAIYGGGVYVKISRFNKVNCAEVLKTWHQSFINFTITGNKAITKGDQLLFDFGSYPPEDITNCHSDDIFYLSLQLKKQSVVTVFPGQQIKFEASSKEICEATLYVTCSVNSSIILCPFDLTGSSKVIIPQGKNNVTTHLKIKTDLNITHTNPNIDLTLHVVCQYSRTNATVLIQRCMLGFNFNDTDKTCHGCEECDPALYQYSLQDGIACVQRNYWYGNDSGNVIVSECYFPFCNYKRDCPLKSVQPFLYYGLPENQDDQCYNNKGKILCRQCRDGYHFTYLGIQCVEGSSCGWNLLGLILLAIILNIIVGLLWLGIMRFKGGLTFGISLGPLIFIAFGQLISFGAVDSLHPIQVIFAFLSLIILDNSILGYIPLCTPITTGVGQQVLNYIGPFVIIVMIMSVGIATNCCPRYSNKVLKNPIQTICLLALVTFWSLARTSVTLLLPTKLLDSYRFFVDPNVHIASYYAFIWLVSIPVFFLVIGVIIFMAVSPFLSRRFNTIRIKPILDVFHSPYKDKWRWYSSVYFATWVITSIFYPYSTTYLFAILLFLVVSAVHFVFQPYNLKWLNVVDTLLLFDLFILYNTVAFLSVVASDDSAITKSIMVYVLSLLPPLCYLIMFAILLLSKSRYVRHICDKIKKKFKKPLPQEEEEDLNQYYDIQDMTEEYQSRKRVTSYELQADENDYGSQVLVKRDSFIFSM